MRYYVRGNIEGYIVTDLDYLDMVVKDYGQRVFAQYNKTPDANNIYIGRPSILGNPYMTNDSKTLQDRMDNCIKFRNNLFEIINTNSNPALIKAVRELDGKNVICWCSNGTDSVKHGARYCHGHVLLYACDYLNGEIV